MAVIGTDVARAADLLRKGQLVAIPTETVYGLAANAYADEAVVSIFAAKQRPAFDPLIVHTHSIKQFEKIAVNIPPPGLPTRRSLYAGPSYFNSGTASPNTFAGYVGPRVGRSPDSKAFAYFRIIAATGFSAGRSQR